MAASKTAANNARTWESRDLSGAYAKETGLFPSEVGVLATVWSRLADGVVLDVGVGGGRTVMHFSTPARRYLAVDLSQAMVDACREAHPGTDVRQDDARHLGSVDDESCDVVLFSYNGIDYVPPEERSLVYTAARRVLRPGGMFAFSTHNLRSFAGPESPLREIRMTLNPARMAARVAGALVSSARSWGNRMKLRSQERHEDGWALLNDGAYVSTLLTVYVDPKWQVEELERAGFRDVAVIGERGVVVSTQTADRWPWFVATRR